MFNLPIKNSISIFQAGNCWAVVMEGTQKMELPFDPAEFVKQASKGHDPILSKALEPETEIEETFVMPMPPRRSDSLFLFNSWKECLDFLRAMEERSK